jgi:hypothetical protein
MFYPLAPHPYILVVSAYRSETTVSPLHFVALYINANIGVVVNAGTYHRAVYPMHVNQPLTLLTKQGKVSSNQWCCIESIVIQVHANVLCDFMAEFDNVQLRVPNAFAALPPSANFLPKHIIKEHG